MFSHSRCLVWLLLGSLALPLAGALADQPRLQIAWPSGWEYRQSNEQRHVVQLQARQRTKDHTVQKLAITVIDARTAKKQISRDSIKELVQRLRDSSLLTAQERQIPLHSFADERGYYFTATDSRYDVSNVGDFKQHVEGVMLTSSYLINFTLLTDDVSSASTRDMLNALDRLSIH